MKQKFFLVTLFTFFYSQSLFGISLVFVHLGQQMPHYIVDCLEQARLFNPSLDIYLLCNRDCNFDGKYSKSFNELEIQIVLVESLSQSPEHALFLKNTKLDARGGDGFWLKTSQRLFYLYEFIEKFDLHDVVHMEYDNMLYVDLKELTEGFKHYTSSIGAVFDSDNRAILSFMFIPKPDSLKKMVKFFADESYKGLNDMQIPPLLQKKYGIAAIDNLPLLMRDYVERNVLTNKLGEVAQDKYKFCKNSEIFNSIFDGAAIGQYLGGIHVNNPETTIGFINETAFIDPSKFTIVWKLDDQNRKVPYLKYQDTEYRINNLHIHSKTLHKFKSR